MVLLLTKITRTSTVVWESLLEIKLKTRFGTLAAVRSNPGGNLQVLAMHGWLDNAESFGLLAPLLPLLDLVAVDFPGHGNSPHRSVDSSYMFADWVREVFAAADALEWQKFHLLGHSMGAAVSTLAGSIDKDRVLSVCCLDGFMPLTSNANELVTRLRDYVRDAMRERRMISFASEDAALQIRARAGDFENLGGLRKMVARNILLKNDRWVLKSDPRLMTHNPLRLNEGQLFELAESLHVPVHVVIAESGLDFVKNQVRALGSKVQRFSQDLVRGYHHVHIDAPERVAPMLAKFYSQFI